MPTPHFYPLFPMLHQILMPLFPGCLWLGNAQKRQVALTFDDGPHPHYTPGLLEILAKFEIKATFFWLGLQVERSPDLARQVYQQGHGIGLHGYDHKPFVGMTVDQLRDTLTRTEQAICNACGIAANQLRDVRPPYGLFTPQTLKYLQAWNYRPVMWSAVPEDWVAPGLELVQQRVLREVKNGAIIVLHDGVQGGPDVAANTLGILPQLLAQGYKFVTIEQLWADSKS